MAEEGGVPLEGEAGIATPPQPSFEAIYSGAEGHAPTVIIDSEHPPAGQYGQIRKNLPCQPLQTTSGRGKPDYRGGSPDAEPYSPRSHMGLP